MRASCLVVAFATTLVFGSADSLLVRRNKGSDHMEVELARQSVHPGAAEGGTFVEPADAASDLAKARATPCAEGGCSLLDAQPTRKKNSKEQRQRKLVKSLRKEIGKARTLYLEKHTEAEYQVLKYGAILHALNKANGNAKGFQ